MQDCCNNSEGHGMNGGCACMGRRHRGFRCFKIALAIVLMVYLGILARNAAKQYNYIGRPTTQRDTIAISAEGKITATPDIAKVTVGVQTQKDKVTDAQTENTTKMNAIVAKLKSLGIADADIQTSSYNISPQYDYVNGTQVQRGFIVAQSVDVKIRKLDSVGDVLSAVGTLGANQVSGVSFTIDDPDKLQQQARLKALEAAKAKAQALADAAGVKLGKVVGFSESVSGGTPPPIFYSDKVMAQGMGGAVPTPSVEAGSQDVIVNVTVNYEIL